MNQHIKLFNQMIEVMQRFYPNLSTAFILQLKEYIHFVEYFAGDIILYYKEIQSVVWFQATGISAELTGLSGVEITTFFWFTNDFLFTTPGFCSQQASASCIQIIENSILAYISAQDFAKLKQQFPETEILSENIRDYYKTLNMQHLIDNNRKSLDRVKHLYRLHEELFELCSKKRLASYLGMAPGTLTRAMRKLGFKEKLVNYDNT